MTAVVAAATGADLDVVLVRPDRWVARRPLPPNVRTTDWLPFPEVLPAAAGVVHHGGLRTSASEVAAEMAAMPHPAELVPRLAALVGR